MESFSIQNLCEALIGSSIRRCLMSESICRLTVLLKCIPDADRPVVRISISDTGVGSCLTEFQGLRYSGNHTYGGKWDGMLYVTTTSISDEEIYQYHLNLVEHGNAKRLTRLPSTPKNGTKFSGTEVSLSTIESIEELLPKLTNILQKVCILKNPKVALDLTVEHAGSTSSRCTDLYLVNDQEPLLPSSVSNLECLISGFKDYVLKHENPLAKECQSCFSSREHLKIGSGVACSIESLKSPAQVIEAVAILTSSPQSSSPSCIMASITRTKVLYLQDFMPCAIPQSSINVLTNFDWKSYGLTLRAEVVDGDGHILLEWENLPPFTHVYIVIHCYHKKIMIPQGRKKIQFDKNLVKKAVKFAMDDLKEKYAGTLLSAPALKVRSYAPDLARSIAGLILSSNDSEFQEECICLLGLPSHVTSDQNIEDCIKEKIVTVVEMSDRKPQKNRASAPFLFENETIHEDEFQDEDEAEEELGW